MKPCSTGARARPRRVIGQAGFGLLEAIVALSLLAGTGLALFSWIQLNLQAASRLHEHELEARLLLSAQALVATVNPMLTPEGSLETGDLRVSWRSELIEPVRRNLGFGREATGPFMVGLYRLEVRTSDLRQQAELSYAQWQVGTRRDAPLEAPTR